MSDLKQMELLESKLSPAAGRARISVSQANKQESMTVSEVVYGQSAPVLLASCARSTPSSKTSAHYSQEAIWLKQQTDLFTEHGLEEYCETWPKSGMTVSGTAYRLETLMDYQPVRHTEGNESGLWPTPDTMNHRDGRNLRQITKDAAKRGARRGVSLHHAAENPEMWPTPSANEDEDAAGTPQGNMQRMLGNCEEVRGDTPEEWAKGTLNPTWVSLLMGLPTDWLELEEK